MSMTPDQRRDAQAAVSELQKERDKVAAREAIKRLYYMVDSPAPPQLKLHYLVTAAVPQLARVWGVQNLAAVLAIALSRGLALQAGMCVGCYKEHASPESDDKLCPACARLVEEMMVAVDKVVENKAAAVNAIGNLLNDGG